MTIAHPRQDRQSTWHRTGCALVLVSFLVSNCGGATEASVSENRGGSSAGGSFVTMGGAASPVSKGGSSARASTRSATCMTETQSECVLDCFADSLAVTMSTCVDGVWICPSNYVAKSACPAGACAVDSGICCNIVTGDFYNRSCNDNGYRQTCSMGTRQEASFKCLPDALGVSECTSLDGQPCSAPAVTCIDSFASRCDCDLGDAGGGTWSCQLPMVD